MPGNALGTKDESHMTPSSPEPATQWETEKRSLPAGTDGEQRRASVLGSVETAAGQDLKGKLEAGSLGEEPEDGWVRLGEGGVL